MRSRRSSLAAPKLSGWTPSEVSRTWFLIVLVLWLTIGVVLVVFPDSRWLLADLDSSVDDSPYYLLSGFGQALAAILAVVFTLSMIVAQLAGRHSLRAARVSMDAVTLWYILAFTVAVCLPFLALAHDKQTLLGHISLWFGTLVLFMLGPYLIRLRESASPEGLIQRYLSQACRNPSQPHELNIERLESYANSARREGEFRSFGYAVEAILLYDQWWNEQWSQKNSQGSLSVKMWVAGEILKGVMQEEARIQRAAVGACLRAVDAGRIAKRHFGVGTTIAMLKDVAYQDRNTTNPALYLPWVQCLRDVGERLSHYPDEWGGEIAEVISDLRTCASSALQAKVPLVSQYLAHSEGSLSAKALELGVRRSDRLSWIRWLRGLGDEALKAGDTASWTAVALWLADIGGWATLSGETDMSNETVAVLGGWNVTIQRDTLQAWKRQFDPWSMTTGHVRIPNDKHLDAIVSAVHPE